MMPTWNVLIADDEPAARRGVRQLLAASPDFTVVGESRNGAEVLASLDRLQPDVLFLDIQMPGIDGFEAIRRRTPERMPLVVFLTAYEEHALRAFEAQAFDYLVKPVTQGRFDQTLHRIRRQAAEPGGTSPGRIVISTRRGLMVVALSEIDWIEAADNYARIWIGTRNYLVREPLNALEGRARRDGFVRAHRSALVRMSAIEAIERETDGQTWARLRGGTRVPLARRRRTGIAAALRANR